MRLIETPTREKFLSSVSPMKAAKCCRGAIGEAQEVKTEHLEACGFPDLCTDSVTSRSPGCRRAESCAVAVVMKGDRRGAALRCRDPHLPRNVPVVRLP